jgi:hypothetical protein
MTKLPAFGIFVKATTVSGGSDDRKFEDEYGPFFSWERALAKRDAIAKHSRPDFGDAQEIEIRHVDQVRADIEVAGESIGYQFARESWGSRTYTRTIKNLYRLPYDRVVYGTAIVKNRRILVRKMALTFGLWEAVKIID